MAHEVQVGVNRFKVRSPLAVFGLGVITCGFYVTYWWIRSAKDLEQLDRSQLRGRAGVNAAPQVWLAAIGSACFGLRESMAFMDGWRAGQARAAARAAGATPEQVKIAGHATSTAPALAALLMLIAIGLSIAAMVRMRRDIRRTMSSIGMLPEELSPNTISYVLTCIFLGIIGSASANQMGISAIWEQYPRYFASIGGTKEDIAAANALLAPNAAVPSAQPSNVVALPMQAVQPVQPVAVQPTLSPAAQRMQQLEPGARAGTLSHAESYEYAQMSEQVHGSEAAAPWYAYVVQTDPSNALAAYWYGVYQLARGDESGITTLQRALADQRTCAHAQQQIVTYLQARGRNDEAARYLTPAAASSGGAMAA